MLRISRDAMYRLVNMPLNMLDLPQGHQTATQRRRVYYCSALFFNKGERKAVNSKARGLSMALEKGSAYFRFQRSASLVGISSSSNSPR